MASLIAVTGLGRGHLSWPRERAAAGTDSPLPNDSYLPAQPPVGHREVAGLPVTPQTTN